ncbi:hypothetical protein RQP53_07680 [Paucibacter sp. APW11]|uniref:Phage tail protein n=1 Tax=Roseateles aquae TaxID=3077235 RepID=A0ABU3P991_9BURK|nr:hypothetical protein [Paucibacter sp. APW11]MDT8999145.1 hypothetical protein [Paucibacter sp. APW11]
MPQGCEILINGASDAGLDTPTLVRVTEEAGAASSYSLFFDLRIADGTVPLLEDERLGPDADLAVRVRAGGGQAVLVRGPVTAQGISLKPGAADSVLEVCGADVSIKLGREVKVRVWPTVTDEAAISQLLGDAALTPRVTMPTTVSYDESKNVLVQRETDLHLIRRLSRHQGCWLWLTYEAASAAPSAHIARPPVDADTEVHFYMDGEQRNIEAVRIDWNSERITAADSDARDSFAADDLSGTVERSPLSALADHALADILSQPRRARLTAAVDEAGDLQTRSEAALIEQAWFVSATLSVTERVLKNVVRAPSIAELHGVGHRHSGRWLVARVVHEIDDQDHRMQVTLVRNAWN